MIRCCTAEALGTAFLLAIVVGSGIMGQTLAAGNTAIALLGNTIATGAGLVVLIAIFGPVSGAHFNPAVTMAAFMRHDLAWRPALAYVAAQGAGAVLGVWTAHAMFAQDVIQISTRLREGPGQMLSEFVATFGLIGTIYGMQSSRGELLAAAVGLYITAAYWFTASTSFANPAVTMARALSDSFSGIAPGSVGPFILAQVAGAAAAAAFFPWLFAKDRPQ